MKKTTQGLRDMLFEELEMFLSGKVDSNHVKSVTRITGSILATVEKDIEATKLLKVMATNDHQPKSIADLNLNILLGSGIDASGH